MYPIGSDKELEEKSSVDPLIELGTGSCKFSVIKIVCVVKPEGNVSK